MSALPAGPGDVLAVWTSGSLEADLIRAAEAVEGKPAVANHVVIITHQDSRHRWIGIQGQPGGVGLCDCTPYLSDSRTRSNHLQPRLNDIPRYHDDALHTSALMSGGQLPALLAACAKSMGIGYDWVGIAEDGLAALHAEDLSAAIDLLWRWPASASGLLPGHVVCSSLAAMLYDLPAVGWKHPDLGTERKCEPSDWWDWSDRQLWKTA